MATIDGVVKAKTHKPFGYGILVNDKWYNSKEDPGCEKGDSVSFDDGGRNYIQGLVKTAYAAPSAPKAPYTPGARGTGGGYNRGVFPVPKSGDGSRSIVRQNALTNAIATLAIVRESTKTAITVDQAVTMVFQIARQYEAYSAGDIDVEAAKAVEDLDVV